MPVRDTTMDWTKFIEVAPGLRGGKPYLIGTRITPTDVLEYLAGGMSEDEILRDFPSLTRDHIRAVLAYAAERERRYVTHSATQLSEPAFKVVWDNPDDAEYDRL